MPRVVARAGRRLVMTLVAVISMASGAACTDNARFPAADPRHPGRSISATLYRPEGPGPFAAVALFHGSTGVLPYHHHWAKWLTAEGYVALVVDSFGPRGVERDGGSLTGERVWDAFGALAYLRSLSFVDPRRIGAMGWSLGGGVVLLAGGELFGVQAPPPGTFRAVIALYPTCALTDPSELAVPVLFLLGADDTWTPPTRCAQIGRELKESGKPVEWIVYPGASHGFDFGRGGPDGATINVGGHVLRYDERATADAERRTREFLARHLRRAPEGHD